MPTIHTKNSMVEAFWKAMKDAGVADAVINDVSAATIFKVPASDDDIEGYHHLIDAIVELAWKHGFSDALIAIEQGAITRLESTMQGQN